MTLRSKLRPLRPGYWTLRRYLETRVLGTRFQEWIWRYKHLGLKPGLAERYLASIDSSHRRTIVEEVTRFLPLDTLLEVGCNSGPNLALLAERLPEAILHGIDVNGQAIRIGRIYFDRVAPGRVHLHTGLAHDLHRFSDNSMDVVLSDAVLMFIGSDKIGKVVSEMARVARRAVILAEYHSEDPPRENFDGGRYIYDYVEVVHKEIPGASITVQPLGRAGGGWDRYGCLIVVRLPDLSFASP